MTIVKSSDRSAVDMRGRGILRGRIVVQSADLGVDHAEEHFALFVSRRAAGPQRNALEHLRAHHRPSRRARGWSFVRARGRWSIEVVVSLVWIEIGRANEAPGVQ